MTKEKIRYLCEKLANKTNIIYSTIFNYFFIEYLYKLIWNTGLKKYFVAKGGFLLSNMVGIDRRVTEDIDFMLSRKETII